MQALGVIFDWQKKFEHAKREYSRVNKLYLGETNPINFSNHERKLKQEEVRMVELRNCMKVHIGDIRYVYKI